MCSFTSARTVAIVLARSAGREAMYCAGVLTFADGFIDSSSFRTKCVTERLKQPRSASSPTEQSRSAGFQRVTKHRLQVACHERHSGRRPGLPSRTALIFEHLRHLRIKPQSADSAVVRR